MLSTTSSLVNLQLLFSPITSSGISIAERCKVSKIKKEAANYKTNVPVLPSYVQRLTKCIALLSPAEKQDMASDYMDQPFPTSFPIQCSGLFLRQLSFTASLFRGGCTIRTFKTKTTITNEEIKKPEKLEKEDLAEVIKLLVKNAEKKPEQSPFSLGRGLNLFFFGVALFAVGHLIYKQLTKTNFGKTVEDTGVTTNVTFDDIRGADEVKAELVDVVEYLKDPKKFTDMGAKLPKGILLVGPPGTGKTLLAKAVAGEAGVTFFYASGSEFDEMLVGMGALRVRQLFDKARKRSPAIIFLDEIDACGGKRANTTIQPYARQTINQLLQEMDGFTENDAVVVLAATNDANVLDKALVRPGRFDTQVQVLLPDIHGRKEILQLYLDKLSSVAYDTINMDRLASLTIEMTGADLSNIVNQAALRSIKLNKSEVDQEDLEFALDKVRMGPELKTRIRSDKELKATAYHEAGHALVAYYTPAALNIYKATIIQRGPALGHVSLIPAKDDETSRSKVKLFAGIDVCMGGRVAEELMFGKENVSTGASSDLATATTTAYQIVCNFGMSDKMGPMTYNMEQISEDTKRDVEKEVKVILNAAYEKARKLLTEKPHEHKLLAEALLLYESLSFDEIKLLLTSRDLNSIKVKREQEEKEKMKKNIASNVDLQAPVIEYIPKINDKL